MEFETVYTGVFPGEVEVVRARLEAAGFHPTVQNEMSAVFGAGGVFDQHGVTIQVPSEEAEAARELLEAESSEDNPPA